MKPLDKLVKESFIKVEIEMIELFCDGLIKDLMNDKEYYLEAFTTERAKGTESAIYRIEHNRDLLLDALRKEVGLNEKDNNNSR